MGILAAPSLDLQVLSSLLPLPPHTSNSLINLLSDSYIRDLDAMAVIRVFTESTFAKYVKAIRESPKEVIYNPRLLLTAALYATSGIPLSMYPLAPFVSKTL